MKEGINKEKIIEYYCTKDAGDVYDNKRYSGKVGLYRKNLIYQNMTTALASCDLNGEDKILELAPGSGVLTEFLSDKFSNLEISVLDSSPKMIASLESAFSEKIKSGKLKVTVGDAESLPFSDSEFKLVCSLRLLIHYRELDGFLQEIKRVLKPGGIAVVDAHNFYRLDFANVLYRTLINPCGLFGKVPSFYLTPKTLIKRYTIPGLTIEKLVGHKLLPPAKLILGVFGEKALLSLERYISSSWLKHFCADMYIVLKKDEIK